MLNRLVCAAVIGSAAAGTLAQTDVLYGVGTAGSHLYAIQGGSVIHSNAGVGGTDESGIAVYGDIRTTGADIGSQGAQYDLALNATGTYYPFVGGFSRYDGTTDGKNNFSFHYDGNSMYAYDRDWQNESFVCSVPFALMLGITYDRSNGTFWGTSIYYSPPRIINFDSSGSVLSGFVASGRGDEWGLAYEPSSDTLWTIDYGSGAPHVRQYSKSGSLLNDLAVSGLSDLDMLGIEFDLIPAPGGLALLGLGGLGAARRRRS